MNLFEPIVINTFGMSKTDPVSSNVIKDFGRQMVSVCLYSSVYTVWDRGEVKGWEGRREVG